VTGGKFWLSVAVENVPPSPTKPKEPLINSINQLHTLKTAFGDFQGKTQKVLILQEK
jgi:hypothetical protein